MCYKAADGRLLPSKVQYATRGDVTACVTAGWFAPGPLHGYRWPLHGRYMTGCFAPGRTDTHVLNVTRTWTRTWTRTFRRLLPSQTLHDGYMTLHDVT